MTAEQRRFKRPIAREARIARRLLGAIPLSIVVAIVLVRMIANLDPVRRSVAIQVAEAIANRTQGSVQLSGVTFDWKLAPCFQNLQIYTYQGPYRLDVASQQACVERWFSAIGSGFRAVRVRLVSPAIQFQGGYEQGDEVPFVNVEPVAKTSTATHSRKGLRELTVVFDDLRLKWDKLPIPERFASGAAGPIDGQINVQRRGALSAATIAIRDRNRGARIDGRATPTPSGWDLAAAVEGDLVQIFSSVLTAAQLDIRKMPCQGRLGARYAQRQLSLELDLEQYDVDFASGVVSRGRLVGLAARQQLRMTANLTRGTVSLEPAVVEINGVPVDVSLDIRPARKSPSFSAQASLRTIPMARLLRSVPGTQVPDVVQDIDPGIRLALSFEVAGLLNDASTWEPKLDHRLVGVDVNTRTGLEFLAGPFPYRPLTDDGRTGRPLLRGPSTPGWMRYERIPYVQRRAIIVAEDSTFPFHRGIELREVKDAIEAALIEGDRVRGGSTLTQQLVKNLFLTRDRTALRKAVELLLTFHVESVLTKKRIFELYVNLIEWGPSVYGLDAAAHHYFGRSPRRLRPLEMAYLASIIPAPLKYHHHYEQGRVPPRYRRKVNLILQRLHRLGQLPEDAFDEAMNARIRFARNGTP